MRIIYTREAIQSIEDIIEFLLPRVPSDKIDEIISSILSKSRALLQAPYLGQKEEYLEHLQRGHRRLIQGNYKIIYRIEEKTIYITDVFDARQDPAKMKG